MSYMVTVPLFSVYSKWQLYHSAHSTEHSEIKITVVATTL